MQYILSEEEYEKLVRKAAKSEKEQQATINKLCTLVAAFVPIKYWDNEETSPWGCVHYKHKPIMHRKFTVMEDKEVVTSEGAGTVYCDECPVSEYCSQDRHYSK